MERFCDNCGAKLQEGSEFCSNCGKKVKVEELEFVYCPNCGKQVNKEFEFCTECGSKIRVEEFVQQKKKGSGKKKGIVNIGLIAVLVVVFVFGGATVVKTLNAKSNKKTMKAFREFYDDYCSEHYLKDLEHLEDTLPDGMSMAETDAAIVDCSGKIVMMGDKPILAIADMVDVVEETDEDGETYYSDWEFDVCFFEYDGRKVEELTTIPELICWDDGFSVFGLDNAIYVVTDSDTRGKQMYCVKDNTYSELEIEYDEDDGIDVVHDCYDVVHTGIGKSGCDAQSIFELGNNLVKYIFYENCDEPENSSLHGKRFDTWLEYLGTQKIKSELDLQIILAKYLEDKGILDIGDKNSDYFLKDLTGYWKDGLYVYYDFNKETLVAYGIEEEYGEEYYDPDLKLPESIDGYKVEIAENGVSSY